MSDRVFNFSAGPAVLPVPVLEQIRDEMLCLPGAGASVLEISHRSQNFVDILESTKQLLIDLLAIPDSHEVLFLQGGSRLQFSMIPENLLLDGKPADYVLTGSWGKKALEESNRSAEGQGVIAWDCNGTNYDRVPTQDELKCTKGGSYVHITSNETIQGVQFKTDLNTGDVPLVCDCSSDFLSRPINVSNYGLIYACAQKNAGPSGVTVVIVRKDLLERSRDSLPGYLNYAAHAKAGSMFNTPPTFGIYVVGLVAKWLRDDVGGLAAMAQQNESKAKLLYDVIDESNGFYIGHAQPESRSTMNVTFRFSSDELQEKFIKEASEKKLCNLKGHRSVGGIRASIYNAMPIDGVETLRDHMQDFLQDA